MRLLVSVLYLLATCCCVASASKVKRAPKHIRRQSVRESPTFSGVRIYPSPDGSPFTYITATINIPQLRYVTEHSTPPTLQRVAAWVGFSVNPGDSARSGSSGLMQTGCVFIDDGQGDQYPRCWYEFYPSPPVYFSGFQPATGGQVKLELWRNSGTQATAKITDLSTSGVVSGTFSAPSGHSEAGQDAVWIVEDPGQKPLADFGNEYFVACSATTADGNSYLPTDGQYTVLNQYVSGVQQGATSAPPGGSGFSVTYVGPAGTSS